jgi:hypothetical protein
LAGALLLGRPLGISHFRPALVGANRLNDAMRTHQARNHDGRAPEGPTEPNTHRRQKMTEMLEKIALEEHFLLDGPEPSSARAPF